MSNNLTEFTLATGDPIWLNAAHVVSVSEGPDDDVHEISMSLIRMVNGDQWAVRGAIDSGVVERLKAGAP